MKKKMINILLTAACVCSALTGCGNNGDSTQSSTDAVENKGGNKEYDLTLYTASSFAITYWFLICKSRVSKNF